MKKLWNYLTKKLQKPTTTTEASSTTEPKIVICGDPVKALEDTVIRLLKEGQYSFGQHLRPGVDFTLTITNPRLNVAILKWSAIITQKEYYTIYVSSNGQPEHQFHLGPEFTPIFNSIVSWKAYEDSLRHEELMRLARKKEQDNAREILAQAYG